MGKRPGTWAITAVCLVAAIAAACGGGGDDDAASPTAPATVQRTASAAATSSPSVTEAPPSTSEAATSPTPTSTPRTLLPVLKEGFEDGVDAWEVAGTLTTATFAATTEFAATGTSSLAVVTLADGDYRGVAVRADYETLVAPGDDFVLNLALLAPSLNDLYFIGVSWFDSSGAFLGDAHLEREPELAGQFEPWELGGIVPDGAATGRVTIYRVTNSAVTFYIDEVHYRVRGTD